MFLQKNALNLHQLSKLYRKLVGITVHYIAGDLIDPLFFLAIVVL